MKTNIKFSSFSGIEAIEPANHIMLFENNYFFPVHGKSDCGRKPRKPRTDYGNIKVIFVGQNGRTFNVKPKGKLAVKLRHLPQI
jgi:hypothetical protein